MTRPVLTALSALTLWAGAALAQEPSLPPPSQQVPEKIRPDADASGGATLSDKLEKSDGVISRRAASIRRSGPCRRPPTARCR